MKKATLIIIFTMHCLFMIFVFTDALAESAGTNDTTGNINFFLGRKIMDDYDWEPVDVQPEVGICTDFKKKDWPFSVAIDFLISRESETIKSVDVVGETKELDIGIRKIFDTKKEVLLYVGTGLALISGDVDIDNRTSSVSISDSDNGIGVWVNAGASADINRLFTIGIQLRYSTADVTIFDCGSDAGGFHAGFTTGVHF